MIKIQQSGYSLLRIFLITPRLCVCVCVCVNSKRKCIRKRANLSIWPSPFTVSPASLALLSVSNRPSLFWPCRLQMVYTWYAFLTDITGEVFLYTLDTFFSRSLAFFTLTYKHTPVLFYPQPGGNWYPVLTCVDVKAALRWMVHIRLSPNKSGKKGRARDRSWSGQKEKKKKIPSRSLLLYSISKFQMNDSMYVWLKWHYECCCESMYRVHSLIL